MSSQPSLKVTERVGAGEPAARLVLPFDVRQKSRFRSMLAEGREVAVVLERGSVLRGGDLLRAEDGTIIEIEAAPELVSTVLSDDGLRLCRAAYHLGNRHVPLQVARGWLRYQHDHVLDAMLAELGVVVSVEHAPFEPEGGAYHGHAHGAAEPGHEPDHGLDRHRDHEHDRSPDHHHDHGHGHRHG